MKTGIVLLMLLFSQHIFAQEMPKFEIQRGLTELPIYMKLDPDGWTTFYLQDEIASAGKEFRKQYQHRPTRVKRKKEPTLEEFLYWMKLKGYEEPITIKLQ